MTDPTYNPLIPPPFAAILGIEALEISQAGSYEGPKGTVNIKQQIEESVSATVHYSDDEFPDVSFKSDDLGVSEMLAAPPLAKPTGIKIAVTNESTLAAHRALQAQGFNPVSLNFANAVSPGGGFLSGARAQEEYLCRSSALYLTLKDSPMYEFNQQRLHPFYSDAMIYSPAVPVFRNDSHWLLEEPYLASFITSPAPLARRLNPEELHFLPHIVLPRMLKILSVARYHGHDALVLGAWGCGTFGNDGRVIARLFERALAHHDTGELKAVTFAIADTSPERRFISPFAQRFNN
jgi:uncharacterized protein (TIGR02452 family)